MNKNTLVILVLTLFSFSCQENASKKAISSSVLFRMLQVSNQKSIRSINEKLNLKYQRLEQLSINDRIQNVQKIRVPSQKLSKYFKDIRTRLELQGSENKKSGDEAYLDYGHGVPEIKQANNTKIPEQILIEGFLGDTLQNMMNKTLAAYLKISNDSTYWFIRIENAENNVTRNGELRWAKRLFEYKTLAESLYILSRFEFDYKLAEYELVMNLSNVQDRNLSNSEGEDFDAFMYSFMVDSAFQVSRVKFPLKSVGYVDGVPSNNIDTVLIKKLEWQYNSFYLDREYHTQVYDNSKHQLRDTDERVFAWEGVENGIQIYYYFKRIDTKWYLIRKEDWST